MSNVMLIGCLRMPLNLWTNDEIFKVQQYSRCIEAADRIEELEKQLADSVSKEDVRSIMKRAKRVNDAGFISFIKLHEQIENLLKDK